MNPIHDIKGEHAAITIILDAMRKLAIDMRIGKFIDSYRIVQILDFLHTFNELCHNEKEEKCLYPALLQHNLPWTADTISDLTSEHNIAHIFINDIDFLFQKYLSGNTQIAEILSLKMLKYVEMEKKHIKIVDTVLLPLCERVFNATDLKSISIDFKKIQDHKVGRLKYQEYYLLLKMLHDEKNVIPESTRY